MTIVPPKEPATGEPIGCPSCAHPNRPEGRFCTECGARLGRSCARCGAPADAAEKFCGGCGAPLGRVATAAPERMPAAYTPRHLAEKILTSRAALQGERRQVTVLFADVKGSMDLAEQIDAEEWHRLMDRFFQLLAEGVHRFEGTVVQFTGDGIMALFGAPIAHEDHAQRACWAALHLMEALRRYTTELRLERGLGFAVRIGLNSGEVVVGAIGDDLRMDYTANGHAVGLAQRMEQLAEPGKAFVTEHTARLVTGYFALRDLGATRVKGVAEPLLVFELQGPGPLTTRLDVSRSRGFSRFVGRVDEMATLEAALARALAGDGQVVGVVAEAGTGKSRLCHEFAERCRTRGLMVDTAHCVAHGREIPLLPVLEYMRGYFGITERDSDRSAREKVAGKLLLLDSGFAEQLPLLFDFLGVPDPAQPAPTLDPEARQRQLFAATKRLTHARSRREPGVSIVEDLHWIDGGSEAFLHNLVETLGGTRSLLVVNFRPEYHATWMRRSYYQQLPLLPLGPEASAELLRELLGADPSVAPVAERVQRRTGGNPFFIEEIVQGLVETKHLSGTRGAYRLARPVDDTALPPTVQSVLAARIDRLGEREKTVLQTAAVIGKEFAEPVLRRVADVPEVDLAAALATLTRAELVYETALYPEAEYAFKHPLTQEVAYRSQLGERRAQVHRTTARALVDAYADKLDEKAAVLAYHWEAAGEALEAARWHARAAAWSGSSDVREARRHWERVRLLTDGVPESAEAGSLGLRARTGILNCGWRLDVSALGVDDLVAEGRTIAERVEAPGDLARLLMVASAVGMQEGSFERGSSLVEEVRVLAERTGDPLLHVGARMGLGYFAYLAGRPREMLEWSEAAEMLLPEDPRAGTELFGFVPRVFFTQIRGLALLEMGHLDEARRASARAADLARALGALENLGWILGDLAVLETVRGDLRVALDHGLRALELAEKVGTVFSRVIAAVRLAEVQNACGRYGDAAEALEGTLATVRASRVAGGYEALWLRVLSEARLGLGEGDRARAAAEEALAVAERQHTGLFAVGAHLALARARLRTEGAAARAAVEGTLERATALIAATEGRRWQPWVHLARAELAQLVADETARRRELHEAERLLVEMGATAAAREMMRGLGSPRP